MIIVFDLDDTLYEEMKFVKGGMKSVAKYLKEILQENEESIYNELINILESEGRNKLFDKFLLIRKRFNKKLIAKCINIYRFHTPNINLSPDAELFLKLNKKHPKYLVTDGNKIVQARKVKYLKIEKYFKKIFITHRYGKKNSKPSLYCFEKIKSIENCNWEDLVYIGDNPNKDFVSLNKVNAKTIRIKKGNYSHIVLSKSFEAKYTIKSLDNLDLLLQRIF